MNTGRTIFSQLMDFAPSYEFDQCVKRYSCNYKVKTFSCWDQYLCMAFAQLTYRESLRDIEACLRSTGGRLYHMGIRGTVSRNTIAHANENRDYRIYEDFAQKMIVAARSFYGGDSFGTELEQTAYALDATIINLCLSVFPWARFRKHKAAVKLHTLLDLRGSIPTIVRITHGKIHDVNILDYLSFEPMAIYIMDRGYTDFQRLYRIHEAGAFFVTRAKRNLDFQRMYSNPVADRIIFQMDKTTPANQSILWDFRECGQDANMDCNISICARSANQEAAGLAPQPLHNSTDFKRDSFRKNADFTGVPGRTLQIHKYQFRQPVDFAMITLGQQ